MTRVVLLAVLVFASLVACGDESGSGSPPNSGVTGLVHLGPTCPVEQPGQTCDDEPAAGVEVTVHEPSSDDPMTPGDEVASGTTDDEGVFRIPVEPGHYLVTATAGMFCDVVAVSVSDGEYAAADVPCDTGIR